MVVSVAVHRGLVESTLTDAQVADTHTERGADSVLAAEPNWAHWYGRLVAEYIRLSVKTVVFSALAAQPSV